MSETETHNPDGEALLALLRRWEKPPPDMVGRLPRKGPSGGTIYLDYLGHAAVTRILTEADPYWTWEPVAWDADGTPLIRAQGKRLVLWGRLTVLGKTILCCGTCDAGKWEPEKELVGDLLRNGAMRLGVGLSLWAKEEWGDLDVEGAPAEATATPKPKATAAKPRAAAPPEPDPTSDDGTSGPVRAKALKLARRIAEDEGFAPPTSYEDLRASDLWPQIAADLGIAS